jgi:exopolysaccharide biosynthesis polyprenyl glycosylphosphotransferase
MTVFITAMIEAGFLYDRWETPLVGGTLVVWWLLLILVRGGYDSRFLGVGSEEFKRLVTATMTLLAIISIAAYTLPVAPPLRLVVPSLCIGLLLLMVGRWLLRTWLGRQREAGRFQLATLIVGDRMRASELAAAFAADAVAGFKVVGTVQPPRSHGQVDAIEAWLSEVMAWIHAHNIHAVAVAESAAIEQDILRRLAWRLEGPGIDLLVSPALSDVAGPRVSVRPAAGLPLLHLDEPSLTGPKRALKRALDLFVTVPGLVLLAPVMAVIAVAIKMDSLGRVFYVSDRVGRSGETFRCAKFRTMYVGSDALREDIIGEPDEGIAERYRDDPRVTRVGRFLRRWSLDELAQLFNVAAGSMSLVGPRPMLPEELSLLGDRENRRHLTKPGLTGLWQISGRKEVSWEDRMRMDLHYIETWSIALDLVIIAKTTKAVLTGKGAY